MLDLTEPHKYCVYCLTTDWIDNTLTPIETWVMSTRNVGTAVSQYYKLPRGQGRIGIHRPDNTHYWLTRCDMQQLCDHLHDRNLQLLKELKQHVNSSSKLRRR